MAVWKRGTRGEIDTSGAVNAASVDSLNAIVYIGTAPVNQVEGGAQNVNVPILCNNIADARKYLGYSDDWAKYTLCEAIHAHFELKGVGPLVFINVFNPATHKKQTGGTASLTPENGRVVIANAEDIYLDSIVVKSGSGQSEVTKVKGTDYSAAYDFDKKVINIVELSSGALGTTALTITWDIGDPAAVASTDVIGSTDNTGLNTGIFAVKNVYSLTGYIPAYMAAPGFSSIPAVHNVMYQNSQDINGHWHCWLFVDMPIIDSGTAITLATAATWKNANGYNKDNESVYFPLVKGTDGQTYHLSVLACANFQELLIENDGIPYMTASNTDCAIIEDLYLGASVTGRVYDDEIIGRLLNKNGINSAAYVGGRWAIWGCFAASYSQTNANSVNVFETALMMLYYLTNDFQHRRNQDIDQPMTANDLRTIVAEEQSRVDALVGSGALIYGLVSVSATPTALSDMMQGDFTIAFKVTTTPLAKSLTALAVWTSDGFAAYFAALAA